MTDELEQTNTEEEIETTETADPSTTDVIVEKGEKTVPYSRFQQVNSKYRELKAQFDELTSADNEELGKANETLKKYAEQLSANLPDNIKSLVSKLPVTDQLDWLIENGNIKSLVGIPNSPEGEGDGKPDMREAPISPRAQF